MFHWFGVVQNTRGDALPGWQVGLVQVGTQTVVPIYSDENSTPIVSVSGIANRAVADENGNYDFFVPNGTYTLQFYNSSGVFQRNQRFVAMYGDPANTPVTTQSGTSYTLTLNDASSVIRFTSGSAVTLTIPPESSVNFPIGTGIEIHQAGAGQITPTAGAGVTLLVESGFSKTRALHTMAGLRKVASNTWILGGALA